MIGETVPQPQPQPQPQPVTLQPSNAKEPSNPQAYNDKNGSEEEVTNGHANGRPSVPTSLVLLPSDAQYRCHMCLSAFPVETMLKFHVIKAHLVFKGDEQQQQQQQQPMFKTRKKGVFQKSVEKHQLPAVEVTEDDQQSTTCLNGSHEAACQEQDVTEVANTVLQEDQQRDSARESPDNCRELLDEEEEARPREEQKCSSDNHSGNHSTISTNDQATEQNDASQGKSVNDDDAAVISSKEDDGKVPTHPLLAETSQEPAAESPDSGLPEEEPDEMLESEEPVDAAAAATTPPVAAAAPTEDKQQSESSSVTSRRPERKCKSSTKTLMALHFESDFDWRSNARLSLPSSMEPNNGATATTSAPEAKSQQGKETTNKKKDSSNKLLKKKISSSSLSSASSDSGVEVTSGRVGTRRTPRKLPAGGDSSKSEETKEDATAAAEKLLTHKQLKKMKKKNNIRKGKALVKTQRRSKKDAAKSKQTEKRSSLRFRTSKTADKTAEKASSSSCVTLPQNASSMVTSIEDLLPDLKPQPTTRSRRAATGFEKTRSVVKSIVSRSPEDSMAPFMCLLCSQAQPTVSALMEHKRQAHPTEKQNTSMLSTNASIASKQCREVATSSEGEDFSDFLSAALRAVPECTFNNMHGTIEHINSVDGNFYRSKPQLTPIEKVRLNLSGQWTTKSIWEGGGGWEMKLNMLNWHRFEPSWCNKERRFLQDISRLHWEVQGQVKIAFEKTVNAKTRNWKRYDSHGSDAEEPGTTTRKGGTRSGAALHSALNVKQTSRSVKYMSASEREQRRMEVESHVEPRYESTLHGEWQLSHVFYCAVCTAKFDDLREVLYHKWDAHPWCLVAHLTLPTTYTLPPKRTIYPQLGRGLRRPKKPHKQAPTKCTKCRIVLESVDAFHTHILECGGDLLWDPTDKKAKKRLKRALKESQGAANNASSSALQSTPKQQRKQKIDKFANRPRPVPGARSTRLRQQMTRDESMQVIQRQKEKAVSPTAKSKKASKAAKLSPKNNKETKAASPKKSVKTITKKKKSVPASPVATRATTASNSPVVLPERPRRSTRNSIGVPAVPPPEEETVSATSEAQLLKEEVTDAMVQEEEAVEVTSPPSPILTPRKKRTEEQATAKETPVTQEQQADVDIKTEQEPEPKEEKPVDEEQPISLTPRRVKRRASLDALLFMSESRLDPSPKKRRMSCIALATRDSAPLPMEAFKHVSPTPKIAEEKGPNEQNKAEDIPPKDPPMPKSASVSEEANTPSTSSSVVQSLSRRRGRPAKIKSLDVVTASSGETEACSTVQLSPSEGVKQRSAQRTRNVKSYSELSEEDDDESEDELPINPSPPKAERKKTPNKSKQVVSPKKTPRKAPLNSEDKASSADKNSVAKQPVNRQRPSRLRPVVPKIDPEPSPSKTVVQGRAKKKTPAASSPAQSTPRRTSRKRASTQIKEDENNVKMETQPSAISETPMEFDRELTTPINSDVNNTLGVENIKEEGQAPGEDHASRKEDTVPDTVQKSPEIIAEVEPVTNGLTPDDKDPIKPSTTSDTTIKKEASSKEESSPRDDDDDQPLLLRSPKKNVEKPAKKSPLSKKAEKESPVKDQAKAIPEPRSEEKSLQGVDDAPLKLKVHLPAKKHRNSSSSESIEEKPSPKKTPKKESPIKKVPDEPEDASSLKGRDSILLSALTVGPRRRTPVVSYAELPDDVSFIEETSTSAPTSACASPKRKEAKKATTGASPTGGIKRGLSFDDDEDGDIKPLEKYSPCKKKDKEEEVEGNEASEQTAENPKKIAAKNLVFGKSAVREERTPPAKANGVLLKVFGKKSITVERRLDSPSLSSGEKLSPERTSQVKENGAPQGVGSKRRSTLEEYKDIIGETSKRAKRQKSPSTSSNESSNSSTQRTVFPLDVKLAALSRLESGDRISEVARDLGSPVSTVASWWSRKDAIYSKSDLKSRLTKSESSNSEVDTAQISTAPSLEANARNLLLEAMKRRVSEDLQLNEDEDEDEGKVESLSS